MSNVETAVQPAQGRSVRRAARRPDWYLLIGGGVVTIGFLVILGASLLTHANPDTVNIAMSLVPPGGAHPFGTDELGRDVLARVMYGGRISVLAGLAIVSVAGVIGCALGAVSGFFGGAIDELLMRVTDVALSFPPIILAMAIAAGLGPSVQNGVIAMIIVWWPTYARLIRGEVLRVKQLQYVEASRATGRSELSILFRIVLPNAIGALAVMAPMDLGSAIVSLAGLSFLGLGARPPTPELGALLSESRNYFDAWWMSLFPGLALVLMVLGLNLLGEGIRHRVDAVARRSIR